MRISETIIGISLLAGAFSLTACKSEQTLPGGPGGTPAPTPFQTPAPGGTTTSVLPTINAEVYLKVERQLQSPEDAPKVLVGLCQVPLGAAGSPASPGVVTCTPTVHGTFSIPEGDMHYSKLIFTAGTADRNTCAYLIFSPYYYVGSVSNGFVPPWLVVKPSSAIDCSISPVNKACFNGAAPYLFNDFPKHVSFISLTNSAQEIVSVLDSAYNNNQNSNRYAANNASSWTSSYGDPTVEKGVTSYVGDTAAISAGYLAPGPYTPFAYTGAHQDYAVECRDIYYDLIYAVKVILNDEDTSTGINSTYDFYHTWP